MLDALAAFLKLLVYAGALAGAGGAVAAASLRLTSGPMAQAARKLVGTGAGVLAIAAAGGFAVFLLRLGGVDADTVQIALETGPGRAAGLHLAGAAGLIAGVALRRPMVSALAAAPVFAGFAISGHGVAAAPWAGVAAGLHVAATAWWTGSLVLLRAGREGLSPAAFTDLVRRFGRQALVIVGGLVALGLALGLRLLDGNLAVERPYVRFLLVKLAFAASALAIALHNRLVLTPRLDRDATALPRLVRAAGLELGLIAAVAGATALMTTYASPTE
ncbi:CopD family protein [Phenylobacterium sp.]|uniref:CopD family protein n=1 Tax=Phenylobacterium sp. TaxID=1871053 RepID=UPI003D2DE254